MYLDKIYLFSWPNAPTQTRRLFSNSSIPVNGFIILIKLYMGQRRNLSAIYLLDLIRSYISRPGPEKCDFPKPYWNPRLCNCSWPESECKTVEAGILSSSQIRILFRTPPSSFSWCLKKQWPILRSSSMLLYTPWAFKNVDSNRLIQAILASDIFLNGCDQLVLIY